MAPLYHRYIPGTAQAASIVQPLTDVRPDLTQSHDNNELDSRKRKRTASTATARKASRINEELAPGHADVDHQLEQSEPQVELSGTFSHIKSSKKRHKLEKEARQARKQAERDAKQDNGSDRPLSNTRDDSQSQGITSAHGAQPPEPATKPRKKKQSMAQIEDNDSDEAKQRKKHAGLLKKLDKARNRTDQASDSAVVDASSTQTEQHPVKTIDPLVPIELDLDAEDTLPGFSALPSWISSPERVTSTAVTTFEDMGLDAKTTKRLAELNFTEALPVQQALIPWLLTPGSSGARFPTASERIVPDLAVSAPTGSGKTLAYLLPIIQALSTTLSPVAALKALIVVPTRELVMQVSNLAVSLAKDTGVKVGVATGAGKYSEEQKKLVQIEHVYDPEAYRRDLRLRHLLDNPPDDDSVDFDAFVTTFAGLTDDDQRRLDIFTDCPIDHVSRYRSAVDLLVCTPGRLLEHISNTPGFELTHVAWLVLDEADKLLDEQYDGFLQSLHQELAAPRTPSSQSEREKYLKGRGIWDEVAERRIRKIMLSATMTTDISQLSALQLRRPKMIIVGTDALEQAAGARSRSGIDISAGSYVLPTTLQEFCVSVGDGRNKPLQLLQVLADRVLSHIALRDNVTRAEDTHRSNSNLIDSEDELSSDDDSSSDSWSVEHDGLSTDDNTDSEDESDTTDQSQIDSSSDGETFTENQQPRITKESTAPTVLVFAASNEAVVRLAHLIKLLRPEWSHIVTALTKDATTSRAMPRTSSKSPWIVVATDRAGRGLDTIAGRQITHVMQYDVPRSLESYVHRAGRTARAGRDGQAWTFYTKSEARWFINDITKSSSITRRTAVERVRLDMITEERLEVYQEALAKIGREVHNISQR